MTNRERTLAALNHRTPDRIPFHITFTKPAKCRMAAYYSDPTFISKLGNCFTVQPGTEDQWLRAQRHDAWLEVRPCIWRDEFGVEWDRSVDPDIGAVCRHPLDLDAVDDFPWPDPSDPQRYASFPAAIEARDDGFVILFHGWSLFERAWTLVGMETLLMAMAADKKRAHALFEKLLEYNLSLIEHSCSYDVDAVRLGDDWGDQRGLIMGFDLWQEFIGPRMRLMFGAVTKRGKYAFLHSCGRVQELFPELIDYGLHVFNPFQPEVMDVAAMKRKYGDHLCFYGGISTQRTLPYGTVQKTKDEVRRLLDVAGAGGGLIAAPAHDIPADAKPENVAAMIDVLRQQ